MLSEELCLELQLANVFNFEKELKAQYTAISKLLSDTNQLLFQRELDAIDRESDAYKKENAPYTTSDKYRTHSIIFALWIFCTSRRNVMHKYIDSADIEYIRKAEYRSRIYSIGHAYHNRDNDIRQSNGDMRLSTILNKCRLPRASKQVAAYKNIASSKFKPVSYDKKNN